MSDVKSYEGRSVDLVAYHGTQSVGDQRLRPTLADPGASGQAATGIQKLAQRVLLELLKERGSQKYWPDEGNDFVTNAKLGYYFTQSDVLAGFSQGVSDIRPLILADETDEDPDDERFVDLEVLDITVFPSGASIRAKLISRAGDDRAYIFPINIPV